MRGRILSYVIAGSLYTLFAGVGMLVSFWTLESVVPGLAVGSVLGAGAAWVASVTFRARTTDARPGSTDLRPGDTDTRQRAADIRLRTTEAPHDDR